MTDLYSAFSSIDNDELFTGKEMAYKGFYQTQDGEAKNRLQKLFNATVAILDKHNDFVGNGVAIGAQHILTSHHCVANSHVRVYSLFLSRCFECRVVFDGKSLENVDFKILKLNDPAINMNWVPIDVCRPNGASIQMYYKLTATDISMFVRPYMTGNSIYMTRSETVSTTTFNGESGAPRMSLTSGAVHSIHQGASQGLITNEIYNVLARYVNHPHQSSKEILDNIEIESAEMARMHQSSSTIQVGEVPEQKKRVSGELENTTTNVKYRYTEVGEGRQHRKISILRLGIANSVAKIYAIEPNPHENGRYVSGGQATFYKQVAEKLLQDDLPNETQVKALKGVYTCTLEQNA